MSKVPELSAAELEGVHGSVSLTALGGAPAFMALGYLIQYHSDWWKSVPLQRQEAAAGRETPPGVRRTLPP